MANKLMKIAQQVIAGDFGSGEERIKELKKKGYNPDKVQEEVNRLLSCRELIIQNIRAWAIRTSAENYKYVYWTEPYGHECAKCHPHGGKNKGWQCIGFTVACWHHGGLPIPCNCGVIDNGTGERILNAKTDAEALKIARDHLKIKDIKVIRNGGKAIPKEKAQAGDYAMLFVGNKYQHTYLIMGDDKIADSTQGKTDADDIRADRKFSGRYVTGMKVLIRYTGNGLTKPAKKSVDTLAHEVIDGMWYSGDVRKKALTECGYDYDKVQKRVNEILNPPKPTPKPSKKGYSGKFPSYRLKKTREQVIDDAIKFGKWIAGNNDFHYGHGKDAHHNGCYFCGTQPKSKKNAGIKMWETTYCCNPFVTACLAHGGGIPEALRLCTHGKSWDMGNGAGSYQKSKLFDNLGKIPVEKMKKGDVLTGYGNGHVMLYVGNGKVVHAGSEDNNVIKSASWNNSIRVSSFSYEKVFRYNGKGVNTDRVISHGEVSDRVADLQKFLDWYFDGKVGEADGIFGNNTLKWVKKFQEKELGNADGIVGKKTIAAMKKVKK